MKIIFKDGNKEMSSVSMKSVRSWCLVTFLFLSPYCFSQVDSSVGIRISEGFVIAHSPSMNHLKRGHTQTVELSYVSSSDGRKEWHKLLNYPRQGVSFYHLNSGNQETIGSISSLYGYLDFPILSKKRFTNYFKFGSGVAYVQHRFDRTENFRNVAVGSSFNLGFVFANQFEYQWDKFRMGLGLSLVHASSGAFRIPNLGLNISSLDLTMSYRFKSKDRLLTVVGDSVNAKNHLNVFLTSGIRAVNAVSGPSHLIHTLQIEGVRQKSNLISYGAGFDLFYNEAVSILDLQLLSDDPIVQLGGKVLVNLHLDRAVLFVQAGGYLMTESKLNGPIYNRFGGRYFLDNGFSFNFSLKTHLSEADYFEAGFGYKI